MPIGSIEQGTDHLFRHFAESFEGLTVVFQMADVDLDDSGVEHMGIDEEGKVDSVVCFKF